MQRPENAILWFSPQRKVAQIDVRFFFVRILNRNTQYTTYQHIKSQNKAFKKAFGYNIAYYFANIPFNKNPKVWGSGCRHGFLF